MKKLLLLIGVMSVLFSKILVVDDDYGFFSPPCEHGSSRGGFWGGYYDYSTIKDALNDAINGDTIKICPGNYNESGLIVNKNITIQSTHSEKIDDVIVSASSKKPIFDITGWRDGVVFNNFKISQQRNNKIAISIEYGTNYTFSNLIVESNGYGISQNGGSFQNSSFENVTITSKRTSLLFNQPQNITIEDVNLTSNRGIALDFGAPTGSITIQKKNKFNYFKSKSIAINVGDASQDYIIKDAKIISQKDDGINIGKAGSITLENLEINAGSGGIWADTINNDMYIKDVNITESKYENIYVTNVNKLYLLDSILENGDYGLYIKNSSNGGEIKNNIFKNADTIGLQIFDTQQWRGYEVLNNCFENNTQHILNRDKSAVFDDGSNGNYWDDWSGTGSYEIPDIPKYDNYPLSGCHLESNDTNISVNLILNYRMDECNWDGGENDVRDSSDNGYHGTSLNNVNTETNNTTGGMIGRIGNLVDGDFAIRRNISLPTQYTMTMWIKFPLNDVNHTDFSGKKYFNIADIAGSNSDYIYFKNDNGNWGLCVFGNTYECKSYNPQSLSGWHFVTFEISNIDTKFYVDNDLKLTFNQHPNSVTLGLLFNSDYDSSDDNIPNGQSIGAYVDEFKIFSGLVSSSDLDTIYNNELNRKNYDGGSREDIECTYQVCYSSDFSSQSDIDSDWTIIKNQNYTPQVVNNRLRLTTNSGNIATGLTLNNKVFKANGTKFKIRFKHYAYDGSSSKGADGIAAVFSDSSISPVAGAFGGSLGYAQRTSPNNEDGFAGGWIGIGLDEYGNYSNPTEGRVGGPGFIEQAVAIRGSYLENYKYLTGTNSLTPHISNGDSSTPSPGYTYEIDVDTTNTNQTMITIYRDIGSENQVLISRYEYNSSNTPDYFKFSLTGSTGGENNIHEIDDLEILALNCEETLIENNYLFDVKELNRSDKNITTKIVNKSFDLEIISDRNFTGTVCSAVVDNNENNISSWIKNNFNSQTGVTNSYKVTKANKDSRIKIEWLKNTDASCPLVNETNHTVSSDNFAIRPKNFEIEFSSSKIYAGGDFIITFKALDENGNETKDYNETNSFEVNATELKPQCQNGNFDVNVSFSNGKSESIARYSEIGDINISIRDLNFASVDSDDTSLNDRVILPASIQTTSYPYKARTHTNFSNKNIIYMDKNLSRFAEINVTIDMLNKQNQIVQNFDKNCYSDDINISFDVSDNITDSFKGLFDIDGIEKNDSQFETFNNKFEINSSMFSKGEHNLTIKFNIYKNRAYPVSIVDLNFTKTYLEYKKASISNTENIDKRFSFYYLSLLTDDIITSDINSSTNISVIVYDRNRNHFSDEKLLYWFLDTNYNEDDVKILGYTSGFKYDENVTNLQVSLDKITYDYNLSVENLGNITFAVIHYKTPTYLWYSKYKEYNDSLNSYCLTHHCSEYIYKSKNIMTKSIGSGKFKGSEVNITTPKRKKFGIKIYR